MSRQERIQLFKHSDKKLRDMLLSDLENIVMDGNVLQVCAANFSDFPNRAAENEAWFQSMATNFSHNIDSQTRVINRLRAVVINLAAIIIVSVLLLVFGGWFSLAYLPPILIISSIIFSVLIFYTSKDFLEIIKEEVLD